MANTALFYIFDGWYNVKYGALGTKSMVSMWEDSEAVGKMMLM